MAKVPLIDEQVAEDLVILNVEKVGLSDDQFLELCSNNRELHLELTAQRELLIMPLPGPKTGRRNEVITNQLGNWARRDKNGFTFATSTLFHLPNGAKRAPDASWVRRDKWDALRQSQREKLPILCPDFVIDLMSPSDRTKTRFGMLQAKMEEYIENGAQLGWLVDPFQKKVYIYRPDQPVECLENPNAISADPVLPGFVLVLNEVWEE